MQKLESASEVWAEICQIHEDKTELVQIDLRRRLHETRCDEGGDVKAHFAKMLAGMGTGILNVDFHAMILGSLPESYRPLLSSIKTASKVTKTPLSSYELITIITEEYEHCQLTECRPNKKGDSALVVREAKGKGHTSSSTSKANSDITCFNCDQKATIRQIVGGRDQISSGRELIRDRGRVLIQQPSCLNPLNILLLSRQT